MVRGGRLRSHRPQSLEASSAAAPRCGQLLEENDVPPIPVDRDPADHGRPRRRRPLPRRLRAVTHRITRLVRLGGGPRNGNRAALPPRDPRHGRPHHPGGRPGTPVHRRRGGLGLPHPERDGGHRAAGDDHLRPPRRRPRRRRGLGGDPHRPRSGGQVLLGQRYRTPLAPPRVLAGGHRRHRVGRRERTRLSYRGRRGVDIRRQHAPHHRDPQRPGRADHACLGRSRRLRHPQRDLLQRLAGP